MNNQNKNEERDKWKKEFSARLIQFSVDVLKFADVLKKDRVLWPVADQLVRSATSVGANVTEAQGAGTKKDFAYFFQVALKSAKETQYWLLVLRHYKRDNSESVNKLLEEVQEITRIINSSLLTMRGKK